MMERLPDTSGPADCRAVLERESRNNPIIRNVLNTARYSGMSGEDTYSLMAYHLAVAYDAMYRRAIDLTNTRVSQPFLVVNPGEVKNV